MLYNDYGLPEQPEIESILSGASVIGAVAIVLSFLIVIAIAILVIISNCKIFKKAGEDWWKAIIPLYSNWVETKIVGLAWWWFLIFSGLAALTGAFEEGNFVISIALILVSFNYSYCLAKKFGKSNGFAVLTVIFPYVCYPILAFGNAKYDKNAKVDKNGIFAIEK